MYKEDDKSVKGKRKIRFTISMENGFCGVGGCGRILGPDTRYHLTGLTDFINVGKSNLRLNNMCKRLIV